jgi:hypothetical protein
MNAYMENPELYADGRKRIADAQSYYTDGKSAERVAAIMINLLKTGKP